MPTDHRAQRQAWLREQLEPLVGATITGTDVDPDEEGEDWPVLGVRLADGREGNLVVSRDPEGNGPGHLFIELAS